MRFEAVEGVEGLVVDVVVDAVFDVVDVFKSFVVDNVGGLGRVSKLGGQIAAITLTILDFDSTMLPSSP